MRVAGAWPLPRNFFAMKNTGTIPVWVVAGLFGSGKTTLLRRMAQALNGRRFAFIVNELAAVDLDTGVLEKDGGETFAAPGGDLSGRWPPAVADILRQIVAYEELPEHAEAPRFEGVIIEAGGLADPRGMEGLLATAHLSAWFHVAGVVAVVRPGRLFRVLSYLPWVRAQIAAAQCILVNKTDLFDELSIASTEARLGRLRPDLRPVRCVRAEVPGLFEGLLEG